MISSRHTSHASGVAARLARRNNSSRSMSGSALLSTNSYIGRERSDPEGSRGSGPPCRLSQGVLPEEEEVVY